MRDSRPTIYIGRKAWNLIARIEKADRMILGCIYSGHGDDTAYLLAYKGNLEAARNRCPKLLPVMRFRGNEITPAYHYIGAT